MRNAGMQPTQLLQHHPQQQQHPHQLSQHHTLPQHLYGNHIAAANRGVDQIRDVWAPNLEQEFAQIRHLVQQYPYVSMVYSFRVIVDVDCVRTQSFLGWLLDRLDSSKHRMSIIIKRYGVMWIYSR